MSRATVLMLLLLVAGLGFLAFRQWRTEGADQREVPLFVAIEPNQVQRVRIENLERGIQLDFERDPERGGWVMTDPMDVRANSGILENLLISAINRRGMPVGESEIDVHNLGFDPPRFVLELITAEGARQRIDVGAVDLDKNRVNVRARGQFLRAVRDFEVLLDLMPIDYQTRGATLIMPRDVVELHRRGVVLQPDETKPTDLTLDALLEEGRWRATAPVVALLDPLAMSLVLQNTAGLQFEHVTDTAGASLASLGLDPPMMTFELGTVQGETVRMHFGPRGSNLSAMWHGTLAGDPLVWSMAGSQALALAADVTELLDRRLHRFPQGEIDAVQLSTPEREVRLAKNVYGWTVAEARAGSRVFGPARTADPRRVADLLTALDRVEFRAFALDAPFVPDEKRGAVHVRARDASAGGTLGADHATGGVRFQRDGETLVGVVEESLLELVRTSAQDLWSTTVVEIPEVEATGLVLRRGEQELVYERDRYGVWVRKGRTNEARELHAVLDPLLFLRASRHLESTKASLEDPIEVHWRLVEGESVLQVGIVTVDAATRDSGGTGEPAGDSAAGSAGAAERLVVVDHDGRRSVLQRQDLHELLVGLFAGG